MDIVEWLRQFKLSTSDSNYNALIVNGKIEEAADEIERLRKALEIAADGFRDCGAEDLEDMCRAVIAKATGGE
jgi:hypothetical protein